MLSKVVRILAVSTCIAIAATVAPLANAAPSAGDGLSDAQVVAAIDKADPTSGRGAVKNISASGNVVTSGRVTMTLPDASGKVSTASGTRMYRGSTVNYAVRGTADGMQALAVIATAEAAREFTSSFPGKALTLEQGLVTIRAGSDTGQPLAVIDPAWAKDANGKAVPTWYSIVDGSTLIQRITPDHSTGYPVVADPRIVFLPWSWTRPNGAFVVFNSAEQAAIAAGTGATIAAALTRNPWVAGLAGTVMATAYANGICTGGRNLYVYITTGWSWAGCW